MKKYLISLLILIYACSAFGQGQAPLQIRYTGQAAQTATINNIIPVTAAATGTDTQGYSFASIQIISTGTAGTFIFESSNSDANYVTLPVWNNTILTGTPITAAITATASNITYYFPITNNFIRVRIASTITGGSVQALTRLTVQSPNPVTYQVAQGTAANLNTTAVIASGTVTTLSTLTTLANGQTAHSSASTGSPLRVAGRVVETTIATQDQTLVAGDAANIPVSTSNQLITKPFATGEIDWTFACTAPVANTTDVVVKAASGTAGIRTYLTGFQIINSSATIATEVVIKDNVTVIWRGYVGVGTVLNAAVGVNLLTPLKTTANTALNFACITTGSAVYINAQGYTGL